VSITYPGIYYRFLAPCFLYFLGTGSVEHVKTSKGMSIPRYMQAFIWHAENASFLH